MWSLLAPLTLAAGALLVLAGAPKVRDPAPLLRAIRAIGLPISRGLVRVFAVAETILGVLCLLWPTRWGLALMALLYVGFTAFVARAAAAQVAVESCGCFGKADTPPTLAHALVTAGLALAAGAGALSVPAAPWLGAVPGEVLGAYALGGLVAFLSWQIIAVLPTVTPAAIRSIRKA